MLYGETTLWVFASAPSIFSRKNLILSSQNGVPQNRSFCCQAPVEAPRSFFPLFRSRSGFARERKGHLSSTPQKCHPCRSSCMSQIIQKRKGNHTTIMHLRPPRRFSRPLSHFLALRGGTFAFFQKIGRKSMNIRYRNWFFSGRRAVFRDPYRTFSPSEAAPFFFISFIF